MKTEKNKQFTFSKVLPKIFAIRALYLLRCVMPLLFVVSTTAHAGTPEIYEAICGAAKFRVTAVNNGHPLDNTFMLFVVTSSAEKLLFKAEEGGWFDAACLKTKEGKPLLVFQSYCGGSGCLEGKYGAVEPSSLKFLLRPSSKNIENYNQLSDLMQKDLVSGLALTHCKLKTYFPWPGH